jgi:Cu+-exporting ATPase
MALEPVNASTEPDDGEYRDMTRRFWVSLVLAAPVVTLTAMEMVPGQPLDGVLSMRLARWIELGFMLPVVFWGGWPFFERGVVSIVRRSLNMFPLIALGVGVAAGYSIAATLFPGIFPEAFKEHGGQMPVYFEAPTRS